MNCFVQGITNIHRVNIENIINHKTLTPISLYIQMNRPLILIKYDFFNDINDFKTVNENKLTKSYTINPNDNWLTIKSEPFTFQRSSIDATDFIININSNDLKKKHLVYKYNTEKIFYRIEYKKNAKYKYNHLFKETKLVKANLEFDNLLFNTTEYINKAQEKRLNFTLGIQILNQNYDTYIDTISDSVENPSSFYIVLRDENDNLIDINYFLFHFKLD